MKRYFKFTVTFNDDYSRVPNKEKGDQEIIFKCDSVLSFVQELDQYQRLSVGFFYKDIIDIKQEIKKGK